MKSKIAVMLVRDWANGTKPESGVSYRDLVPAVEATLDVSTADLVMSVWMLVNGRKPEYYGGMTRTDEQQHVLKCGAVYKRGVAADSWNTFAGTFEESDHNVKGLSASFDCQCGEVKNVEFSAETGSLVELIKDLLS